MNKNRIIDAHAHIFPEKIAEKAVRSIGQYYGISMTCQGVCEDLIENGKKINVKKYVVHSTATKVEQVGPINEFICDACSKYDSFIGLGTIHPDVDEVEVEVNKIIELGLKGIKLHPDFQDFNIDDESMMAIYKAAEGKLPILIHMGDENKTSSRPKRLARVLDLFPELTVIAAHFGGYSMWDESIEYLVGRKVYFDTSSSLFKMEKGKAEDIIRKHGVEKILFGTDYPMWSHEDEMERFNKLQLSDYERQLILWENASRLFGIDD
ncbi:MAG: TatD family hydrolase [Bacillota bacterium]|nr:TatD family hydrolase [Bacillota bacterium]